MSSSNTRIGPLASIGRSSLLRIGMCALMMCGSAGAANAPHSFKIGEKDFLLDGKRLQIRCGELHFTRVPREYWRNRLKLCKAMGLNAVCAYLFWNFHEWEQGKFDWSGQADAAEFCRIAQEEGLWVVLRPGPYVCSEWEMGGLPWWLLKKKDMVLRSRDPDFLAATRAWFKEVYRVLGPLQVTKGGPILMAQVENEYGFYGKDAEYMGEVRDALVDAGFDIPLFACNPTGMLKKGFRKDIFQVVNFGKDPAGGFKALRKLQPNGPLMCGEFYPAFFDTWGFPHHEKPNGPYLKDLEYMLKNNASFSIYMAHGGTTFGLWPGADRPFKPDTNSYDFDAPITEAGWLGKKFAPTRDLMAKYLLPGETIPEPPPANPVMAVPPFELTETAAIRENLPEPVKDAEPRNMEAYDQGRGCILYRTTLPPGPAAEIVAKGGAHDFAWVSVDGKPVGILDRRIHNERISIPARTAPAQLDILVEAMGRVNFGRDIHDRKGLQGAVQLVAAGGQPVNLKDWQVYRLDLGDKMLAGLKWKKGKPSGAAFWRGSFTVDRPEDTFLDVSSWGKGVLWVNGHCLGRFWNIGPTQTMYLPGPWLKAGANEVIVLDLVGPEKPVLSGVKEPILNKLRPELDFSPKKQASKGKVHLSDADLVQSGSFPAGSEVREVRFKKPVSGRQFCLEGLNAHDGKRFAAIAELDLLDAQGNSIPHTAWTIAYADSEESEKEDGSAMNAINGQTADFWHTEWSQGKSDYPHRIIIDLGEVREVSGFSYTPVQGDKKVRGRIKGYRAYLGKRLVTP